MDEIKLQKGIYSKEETNTYKGANGVLLELKPNGYDGFFLFVVGSGRNYPIIDLRKAQDEDVFEFNYKGENLFLKIYKDKIEIDSE